MLSYKILGLFTQTHLVGPSFNWKERITQWAFYIQTCDMMQIVIRLIFDSHPLISFRTSLPHLPLPDSSRAQMQSAFVVIPKAACQVFNFKKLKLAKLPYDFSRFPYSENAFRIKNYCPFPSIFSTSFFFPSAVFICLFLSTNMSCVFGIPPSVRWIFHAFHVFKGKRQNPFLKILILLKIS